jgi:hypothetical protein
MSEASNLIPKLYEILSVADIDSIQKYFKDLQDDGLDYAAFRDFLLRYNVRYDSDFHNLCLKIDMDRDNRIKFHEFITYFIAEYQHDDNAAEKFSIVQPIAKPAKVLSTPVENNILRVFYVPELEAGSKNSLNASYVTVGCFGDTFVWSLKWKLERVVHFGNYAICTSAYLPN